jgi:hypothetical protein
MVTRADSIEPSVRRLVASGQVDRNKLYHAAVALQRLHDRGIGRSLDIRDMCEVLGYLPPRAPRRSRN